MKAIKLIGLAGLILILAGCEETRTIYVTGPDIEAPAEPRGVTSTTGDGQVWVDWYPNGESDLAGYKIWKASEADGISEQGYFQIGTVGPGTTTFIDQNVTNGTTYFYAVSAYDEDGNESELQAEDVYDTPRPEGFGVLLRDFNEDPDLAGFNFSNTAPYGSRGNWLSGEIYLEYVQVDGAYFINVTNAGVDIQDMGYTSSFDDISYAPGPTQGWSAVGWVEVILGHTYVIWTADYHYAKIRVTGVGDPVSSGVTIDWGYQTDPDGLGNRELKPAVIKKPQHDPATYLRRSIAR